jgi:hypothetical protein
MTTKNATLRLELRTEIHSIINFSVVGDDEPFVLGQHRLLTRGGEVNNRQAPMTKSHTGSGIYPKALAVGSPMSKDVGHGHAEG